MQLVSGVRVLTAVMVTATLGLGTSPASGETHTEQGSFTALSYNVAGLPQDISGSDPATNSSLISPLLNDYDLVLLQENWHDNLHDLREQGLADEVPPVMYHHEVVGQADHDYRSRPPRHPYGAEVRRPGTGPTLIADGLNRLSAYSFEELELGDLLPVGPYEQPLRSGTAVTRVMWRQCHGEFHMAAVQAILGESGLDDEFEELAPHEVSDALEDGAADCGAQKGFSVARTEIAPDVEIDVYNLHADAGSHPRDQAARADNFEQLADFILAHSEGRAVILGGDTNLKTDRPDRQSDADAWSEFQTSTGLTDVCSAIDCGEDDAVIDKFAFRSGSGVQLTPTAHSFERAEFTRSDGEPLSDHDPLGVTFVWDTTGA